MNKQLIKKYKAEFDHWLNGGKVQVFYKKDTLPRWITDDECISCEDIDNFNHILQNSLEPEDVLIAIDDYYSEFRIAMAEGKTIEYLGYKNEWKNLTENCRKLEGIRLEELRVKPERHKFKVGNWVIHNGKYKRVTKAIDGYIDSLDNKVAVIMKDESLELWEPKSNEYFWYKNDLVKFDKTPTNAGVLLQSIRGCSYYPSENFEDFCEPFIGQLPTILKETK